MRRIVVAGALVAAALMLAACAGGTTPPATPTTPNVPVAPPAVPAPAQGGDILSPTQPVAEGEMFPSDETAVPASAIADLKARKPMLVFFYDPTDSVSADQRKEIDAGLRKYTGAIDLLAFDYTVGLPSGESAAAPSADVEKIEILADSLKVNTTPYLVFVDASGRITYRFAGFVDRKLIEREVLRATE